MNQGGQKQKDRPLVYYTVPFFTAKAYNYRRPRLKKDINHLSALIQEETGNEGF